MLYGVDNDVGPSDTPLLFQSFVTAQLTKLAGVSASFRETRKLSRKVERRSLAPIT